VAKVMVNHLLGSFWVDLSESVRPPADFAPCFAARLASSRNVFAISGSGFCFARSCRRSAISVC